MTLSKEARLSLKRKLRPSSLLARKKLKVDSGRDSRKSVVQLGDLPWKSVARPMDTGMGGDDGILELEEVDDVEVYYEETDAGRVAKFRVAEGKKKNTGIETKQDEELGEDVQEDYEEVDSSAEETSFDSESMLPEWHPLSLHPKLTKALHTKGFTSPTAIQQAAIPLALQGRDIVGVAQTGSGKTLAYGLPILNHLLSRSRPSSKHRRRLSALIVAPTRELALQVSEHMNAILKATEPDAEEKSTTKRAPHVSIAAIVGGMSQQKQRRLLDRGVDVLIATPGRMWDMISADDDLANEIRALRFLVLDEADRMIETGHFAELDNILRLTLRELEDDKIPEDQDEGSDDSQHKDDGSGGPTSRKEMDLQTFVFSATLSKDLQRNLRKKIRPGNPSKKKKRQPTSTLDDLLLKLDFRDPEPEIVDLSPKGGVVSTLQEGRVHCLTTDKDVYLLYFLLRHPGRTLVFLGSIDGIRRLNPLMELLNVKAYPLHAQMEQRQRLKNLDRFKSTPNAVLLATDVAARGLDIPAVDHVIHFQIPRTADTYIHRNGRTARANREGFSMLMCAPDERKVVRALMYSLGREESEIPELELELGLLDKLKERVRLAKEIEKMQHKTKKENFEKNWIKGAADALGVDLDSDYFSDNEEDQGNKKQQKVQNLKIARLKAELKRMLAQPLMASGFSAKYITSGSRPVVDDLLAGTVNSSMVGVKQIAAREEVKKAKPRNKRKTGKNKK